VSFRKEDMKKKKRELTRLQAKFLHLYLTNPGISGAECVRKAGYKTKYPNKLANQLLDNNRLAERIKKAREKLRERTEITQDKVLKELALCGFSDLKNYVDIEPETGVIRAKDFEEMPPQASRALKTIRENRIIKEDADGKKVTVYDKVNFELHDKLKALELVGKHLGMFKEIYVPSGNVYIQIVPAPRKMAKKEK
jgi:phage terminase small subunit